MKLIHLCLVFSLVLFHTLIITSNHVVSASEDDNVDAEDHHDDAIANDNKSIPESSDESSLKVLSDGNDGSNKTPRKIKRTIRVHESVPATNESPSGDVQARNGALTNNVEVKPDISIQMPQSSKSNVHPDKELPQNIRSRNSRVNKVPYKPRYTPRNKQIVPFQPPPQEQQPANYNPEPLVEELKDDGNPANGLPYAEEKQQPYKVEEVSPNDRDKISSNEIADSGNQLYNSMSNSDNNKNVMLSNIGNSETVLIDGVGNNKLTKVSNVGNNEQHEHENGSNFNVNHGTPPEYLDTNNQRQQQQHHHHHHYHNEPVHEVKSSSANLQEKPLVQININGNESEKHKVSAASSEAPLGTSSVLVPLINGASLFDLEKLKQLNQVGSPLEQNINSTSKLLDILKPTTLLNGRQPLLMAQNQLPSNYMVVQQAPSLGQGLIGTPLVVAQAQQMISPAATTLTTLVDPSMSTSYLQQQQQQMNQLQQMLRQLGQQQLIQQQQSQQLMSMMSMMMRPQYPAPTPAWSQYAQMWPLMNSFRPPPIHRHSKREGEKKKKSKRERRRERREKRRRRWREEEAEADNDLEDYDEEDNDGKNEKKDEKEKGEEKKEKKAKKVKKSKAKEKEKQPEEQPKSMLSRVVSGLGLPDALRPSTNGIVDEATGTKVPNLNEGQSVKKD